MVTFLSQVAHDLIGRFGHDLSRVAVVFPNKRAGLFFNQHLADMAEGKPMWAPTYLSIAELLADMSDLQTADQLLLVCKLHKVFLQATGLQESIDQFYFWGELLLADFDDADKNLAPVDKLFANLNDLKQFSTDQDFISHEQEEAIRRFFLNFSTEEQSKVKQRFLTVWEKMSEIYHGFRHALAEEGLSYEGMLMRDAIEHFSLERLPYSHYVFVGFNALTGVERRLFTLLQEAERAIFYWDYDLAYTEAPEQEATPYQAEAGRFITRNLHDFPNSLPANVFDNLRLPKSITFVAASTENAQARHFANWREKVVGSGKQGTDSEPYTTESAPSDGSTIHSSPSTAHSHDAVVLCNEDLLLPLLHSVPPGSGDINVTMGFPLVHTPAYGFLSMLLDLQIDGWQANRGQYDIEPVQAALRNPYTRLISRRAIALSEQLAEKHIFHPTPKELQKAGELAGMFTPPADIADLCRYLTRMLSLAAKAHKDNNTGNGSASVLYQEAIFRAYTLVNRLLGLIQSGQLSVEPPTLRSLLTRLMQASKIPFHGEPLTGMQVMGVLETRNLDFRHLLVLSLNEGQLPKASNEASFIPYPLRKAFGLTTADHRDAIYAYYFFRLLQRAETITLCYNASTEGERNGEMSRFMLQLLVHSQQPVVHRVLTPQQQTISPKPIAVEKTPDILERMRRSADIRLNPKAVCSPTALNAYLDCRLRYYYHYVARISQPDETTAEITQAMFGTLVHRVAQSAYEYLTRHGSMVQAKEIQALLSDESRMQEMVDKAFRENFFKLPADIPLPYDGVQLINARVIGSYLRRLLRLDAACTPFEIVELEKKEHEELTLPLSDGTDLRLRVGGIVDRMDRQQDGTLRIVDYKTGGEEETCNDIAQLFTPDAKRPGYIFQAFLYSTIMRRKDANTPIAPALLFIRKALGEDYSPIIKMARKRVDNFGPEEATMFWEKLTDLLREIYDSDTPFTQAEDEKTCQFCDFKTLCRR